MYNNMKKILFLFLFSFLFSFAEVFAECVLNEVPSPPVDSYAKNMDVLIEAVKKEAERSECIRQDAAYKIDSIKKLLLTMNSVWYNLGALNSDTRYYFDSGGTMQLPVFQEHQKSILEIQQKITEAGKVVGSHCAQHVPFYEDVEMEASWYKTKKFNLEEVLTEMYRETTHVLIFYRNLATNVSDREYIDETRFPIAPKWFSQGMREFYSSKNIQACHDEDPKNQQIKKVIKDAFTVGWKYPQAIQIWKEAFALLLYRGGQIFGSGETDAGKEAQITQILEAQKWGLSNSRVLNGKTLAEEFQWNTPRKMTVREQDTDLFKRIAYQVFWSWSILLRQVIPDIKEQQKDVGTVNIDVVPEQDNDFKAREALDKQNYDDYMLRKNRISQDKSRNQDLGVGLINALREAEQMSLLVREMANTICKVYDRQAKNVQRIYGIADCSYFFKESGPAGGGGSFANV